MKVGIVGLPNAGKSTLFNALTRAGAQAAEYPFTTVDPNVAIVPVPDRKFVRLKAKHLRKVEVSRLLEETPENVRAAKQMSATEVSLDAPIDRSDREASTLGERFAGVDGTEIEEVTDYKLMREFIDRVFKKYLTPRERKILYLYYGLEEGSEAMTLEKIGALMGVTRERIRQIRERAFEKLRESPDGRALCGFWAA